VSLWHSLRYAGNSLTFRDMPVRVNVLLNTQRLETVREINYYRSLGHAISNDGMHDLLDCDFCQFPISTKPSSGYLGVGMGNSEQQKQWLLSLYLDRGKCRACYVFKRETVCRHGPK